MGIFGQSSPFDADIEKATNEKNTSEDWSLILDVCDKVTSNPRNGKECLKAIMRRMGHTDPHVGIQAVTLLDACVSNCGKYFHLEVASRDFEAEYRRLLSKVQPDVAMKMRQVLKRWAENEFKNDPQLNLIPSFYHKLKLEGHDFSDHSQKPAKSAATVAALKDPNVVSSQQEEEDIAKAIELSLKEAKNSPKKQTSSSSSSAYPSLYPAFSGAAGTAPPAPSAVEPRKVRALYDFEAAEENELTFQAGEIIQVLDDSDPNWWKGYNQRGEGLFPSNFVTADLSVEPERFDINQKSKKTVQFEDEAQKTDKTESEAAANESYVPEVNETKIDRLLHLLHEANPEDPSQDSEEMLRLEQEVNQMGPLIDSELERVDRKHAQLTQLSSDLVDAINLYHTLMRDDRIALGNSMGAFGGVPMPGPFQQPPQMMYGQMYGNMYGAPQTTQPMPMPMTNGLPPQPPQMGVPGPMHPHPNGFNPQMVPVQYQNGHQNSQQPPQSSANPQAPAAPTPSLQQPPHTYPDMSYQNHMPQQAPPPHGMFPQQPPHMPTNPHQPGPTPQFSQPQMMMNNSPMMMPPNMMMPPVGMMPNGGGGMLPPGMGAPQMPPHIQNSQQPLPGFSPQMAAAINQPVTQTILGQNDSKANIPIYQQQR